MKERLHTTDITEFLEFIQNNHNDYIKQHQRHNYDSPICYEIWHNQITASYIKDVVLLYSTTELQNTMMEIADYTNNIFRCGCVFAIS